MQLYRSILGSVFPAHNVLTMEIYPVVTSHAVWINGAKAIQVPARYHTVGHQSTEWQGYTLFNSGTLPRDTIPPVFELQPENTTLKFECQN